MTENIKATTLLSLITQQVREIVMAGPTDDPALVERLTTVTEQLHGAQVVLQMAGMNPATHPVPKSPPSESSLEDHITRLPPKQQAEADRAPEPPPAMPDYPSKNSPEWKQIVDMLRIVKGGVEAETHEVKAAIRGNYPVFQVGDKFYYGKGDKAQLHTCTGVRMPLENNEWVYKPSGSEGCYMPASQFTRADTPVKPA